jgi:calcineurin-like phosphoesterase family protein
MPNLFLTADQHHGHRNIIDYCSRPFADLTEMTETIIERHNKVVGANDEVIHVGDFSLDDRFVAKVLPRLRGRHTLVPGNHDRCHAKHQGWQRAERKYKAFGFAEIAQKLALPLFDVVHMPYQGDHTDYDRYKEWRPKDEGRWLLHGHVHELWKVRGRMINVGVDVWDFTPVAYETLCALQAAAPASS